MLAPLIAMPDGQAAGQVLDSISVIGKLGEPLWGGFGSITVKVSVESGLKSNLLHQGTRPAHELADVLVHSAVGVVGDALLHDEPKVLPNRAAVVANEKLVEGGHVRIDGCIDVAVEVQVVLLELVIKDFLEVPPVVEEELMHEVGGPLVVVIAVVQIIVEHVLHQGLGLGHPIELGKASVHYVHQWLGSPALV